MAGYFLRLTGAFMLGAVTLAVAVAAVFLLSPYILPLLSALFPFLVGALLVIAAVVIIWIVLYICTMVGVAIYYAIRHPMEVDTKSSGYSMNGVKESGMREKKEEEE